VEEAALILRVAAVGPPMIFSQPLLKPGSTRLTSSMASGPFSVSQSVLSTGSIASPNEFRTPYA